MFETTGRGEKRTEKIEVRITASELEAVIRTAARCGLPVPDFVRLALNLLIRRQTKIRQKSD